MLPTHCVLIDDTFAEAQPLVKVFSQKGMPCLYFNGEINESTVEDDAAKGFEIPSEPLEVVRFIFTDLLLAGMSNFKPKESAAKIADILDRIIRKDNGPYALVYWSNHSNDDNTEFSTGIYKYCTESGTTPPVVFCDLDKSVCHKSDVYDLTIISEKLTEKLKEASALKLYAEWEKIASRSAADCIQKMAKVVTSQNEKWSKETGRLFWHLYKQHAGKVEVTQEREKFKRACHVMNMVFHDQLEHNVDEFLEIPEGFVLENNSLEFENRSKLNSAIFISTLHASGSIQNGYVYLISRPIDNDEIMLKALKKNMIKQNPEKNIDDIPCQLILATITPGCDIAQNKCLSIDGKRLHRVIYGLLFQCRNEEDVKRTEATVKTGCEIFKVETFFHGDFHNLLCFNFMTLSSAWSSDLNDGKMTYVFALKREILFDLQSKAASHVNRLGHLDLG